MTTEQASHQEPIANVRFKTPIAADDDGIASLEALWHRTIDVPEAELAVPAAVAFLMLTRQDRNERTRIGTRRGQIGDGLAEGGVRVAGGGPLTSKGGHVSLLIRTGDTTTGRHRPLVMILLVFSLIAVAPLISPKPAVAAAYDVEVTNPATNLDFFWYKAQLRRNGCVPEISFQVRDASWSAWLSLGGCTNYRITAAVVPAGGDWAVQAFVRGTNNVVYTNYQLYRNSITAFNGWQSLGGVAWSPVGVARNADGRLQLAVRGSDERVHTMYQTVAGNNSFFSNWQVLLSPEFPNGGYAKSDPYVGETGQGASRLVYILVTFPNGLTYWRVQAYPNCSSPFSGCFSDHWERFG
jgi:hypothetical protein